MSAPTASISVPVGELDRLQVHAVAALHANGSAWHAARKAGSVEGEALTNEATENVRAVVAGLTALGARTPGQVAVVMGEPIPFHKLDTPDARELLAGLERLLPVAERLDASRGRSFGEVIGGSAGCDVAEDLAQLIARLSLEIHGPSGSVTEARE